MKLLTVISEPENIEKIPAIVARMILKAVGGVIKKSVH
jgi:hypothetical protein